LETIIIIAAAFGLIAMFGYMAKEFSAPTSN
jgi:hypothetical protein